MTIAEKRTYLTKKMTHNYFANMDSDDIYMESFLKYSLDLIKRNKAGMCGSPEMIFVWPHLPRQPGGGAFHCVWLRPRAYRGEPVAHVAHAAHAVHAPWPAKTSCTYRRISLTSLLLVSY